MRTNLARPVRSGKPESHALRDLAALIFIFAGAFTFLALFSHNAKDPSLFTASSAPAKNLTGWLGSHWSALLLQTLGATAFLFAFQIVLSGVALFRRVSGRDWILAVATNFFLLLCTSSLFGIAKPPLHLGGSTFPMGGLLGTLTGAFLYSNLNTWGAILLTMFFFVIAISLSIRVSVRDMALYTWLGVSKASVFVAGISLYAFMRLWSGAGSAAEAAAPYVRRGLSELGNLVGTALLSVWHKGLTTLQSKMKSAEPAIVTSTQNLVPEIQPKAQRATPLITEQAPAEFAEANALDIDLNSPTIVTDSNTSHDTEAFLTVQDETAATSQGRASGGSLLSLMKKAVRTNERAVKSALGKKQHYEIPPVSLLHAPIANPEVYVNRDELIANSRLLEEKLKVFKVAGEVVAVKPGPVVTMYEFRPQAGVKVQTIANLSDDLALALCAQSVRIVAPIPGRDVVGIEVPNKHRESVVLKEIVGADTFQNKKHAIPIAIGKDILGAPVVADLKQMPHMLVAGATGSGKSVFINALICSLLYRFNPEELRMILVDPKQLELAPYEMIPHLLLPVVTDPKKASLALRWAVEEMERRYRVIARSGMRDADGYNKKFREVGAESMTELLRTEESAENAETMPKLIIVIDELADLMMTAKSDVETNVCRLAQKARAAGIHLVLATQRPSVDVITGLIKANLPARISFRLSSKNDSRTIFDVQGAERLVGKGDMLFMPPGDSRLLRMHGAYVGEDEVEAIAGFWREQGKPEYREEILVDPEEDEEMFGHGMDDYKDPLFEQALDVAYSAGAVSASMLQRRLRVGYNRAARMVESMEARGIVGPGEGSKPRPIIGARP